MPRGEKKNASKRCYVRHLHHKKKEKTPKCHRSMQKNPQPESKSKCKTNLQAQYRKRTQHPPTLCHPLPRPLQQ